MSTLADVITAWETGTFGHDQALLPQGAGTWFTGRVQTDGMVLACDGHIIGTTCQNRKYLYRCTRNARLVALVERDEPVVVYDGCPSCDMRYGVSDLKRYLLEKLDGK